mgnify:CR=1 FL=1
MTDHTLLPCPFCGGEPKLFGADKGYCYVKCPTCFIVTCYYYDVATTIAAWNRRSTPTPDVPEGWVLLPREPTDGMIDKGESALVTGPAETELQDAPSATWAAAKACYRAMISAAPAAPTDE